MKQKIVGLWLTSDMKWAKNTKEITTKAFSKVSVLTKLKYVGVKISDLLDIYVLKIRSVLEYCCVVWHSRLTSLERVQKTCLRIVLGEEYNGYEDALNRFNLETLFDRRETRCLSFVKKCLKHPKHSKLFPKMRNSHFKEQYKVNFGRTEIYRRSAIPYLQRKLNEQ